MARILILGGGFAALAAAEKLAAGISENDELTLVSADHNFTFYPALVPFIFDDFPFEELQFDLRPCLAERNIRFVQGSVFKVDPKAKTVHVKSDGSVSTVEFDYLVIATGRGADIQRIAGFSKHANHLLGVEAASRFKNALSAFDSGTIVVGLCPEANLPVPVCETALGLAKRFKNEIKAGDVSVIALFPSTIDKAFFGSSLFRDIEGSFDANGIRVVPEFPVELVRENEIVSALGSSLHYDLLMLLPPCFAARSPIDAPHANNEKGFLKVNEMLRVAGCPGIYAAGDIISLQGPRFGYMAIRQGKTAASNVLAKLNQVPETEYAHKLAWAISEKYTDPVYFHYGFWDETLDDFDDGAFFGKAKRIRELYGPIKPDDGTSSSSHVQLAGNQGAG